jgi:hypothetical protein
MSIDNNNQQTKINKDNAQIGGKLTLRYRFVQERTARLGTVLRRIEVRACREGRALSGGLRGHPPNGSLNEVTSVACDEAQQTHYKCQSSCASNIQPMRNANLAENMMIYRALGWEMAILDFSRFLSKNRIFEACE